jgi:hypothetical protein
MPTVASRLAAIESRTSAPTPRPDLFQYRGRPAEYIREYLRQSLTPQQADVCAAVAAGRRLVLVPSGNEVGKTWLAAGLTSWNYDAYRPGLTLTTAPTAVQVGDLLWAELRRLRGPDAGFLPRANYLGDAPDHYVRGYTARDATAFQGRHGVRVLVIFDEAEGIDAAFWDAALSMADQLVAFYNPTTTGSQAAVEERRTGNEVVRLSALDHPNITAGLLRQPLPYPSAVTLDKVSDRLARWATRLAPAEHLQPGDVTLAGVAWRPGPVAEARILGRRPSVAVNSLFGLHLWQSVESTHLDIQPHWPAQVGCDVARYGDDFTEIIARRGPCVVLHEAHNGWSTTQTAARLRAVAAEVAGDTDPRRIPIVIDDTGVGGGVTDQHCGFRFIGVNFASKAPNADEYPDTRSQLYFDLATLATAGHIDVSRLPAESREQLRQQLTAIMYTLDLRGRRRIEPKRDMKARLGRSPDTADALALAFFQFPDVFEKV